MFGMPYGVWGGSVQVRMVSFSHEYGARVTSAHACMMLAQ